VIEVCAGLAATVQDWERAARLYGAAEAEAALTGIRRDTADEGFLVPRIDRARVALGPEAFATLEARGRELTYDEALEEAGTWLRETSAH
jgi:hypothetical protein